MSLKINTSVFFTIAMLIIAVHAFSQDTIHNKTNPDSSGTSNSAIKSKIIYNSRDSIRFDVKNQKVFLFGDADVQYEDMELKADYIEFDMSKNTAFAHGARDSAGNAALDTSGMPIGDPIFSDGEKSFDAKEITYNFETKKGKIREVTTQEGEAFIHAKDAKKDTGDIYYIKNGRYTTCDFEQPHFYIKATKLKVIPDDKIITGPAYLVIGDVPTPLIVPFGVFPNKKGRKSGILIPFYGQSNLGYFLKDGGYYFGMSDYFDLALRGDIYSQGSYGVKTHTNYNKRYKYNGNLGISYSEIKISEKEFPDYEDNKDFFVRWSHTQDPKANPTVRFTANVNAGSSSYNKFNSNNPTDYLSNTFQSNVAWSKSWQGKPYNLSVNMTHMQNTIQKTVDVTLPEAAFSVNRFYPFKRKEQVGKLKRYEKIGTSFSLNARNQISTYDSLLFKESSVDRLRNGIKATIPISYSENFGPVIMSPSASFNSYGYFQTIRKRYDTISETVKIDTVKRFSPAYDFNAALSFSTKLYGMFLFKHTRVKAIRHVLTPSASLSYRPDFSQSHWGYYQNVQINSLGNEQLYSIFQNAIYGSPASGKSGYINLALNNNLEMKVRPSKKDTSTTDKKVMLLDIFSISASYNMAVDSFNWSNINLTGRTQLFKILDLTFTGILDPYKMDYGTGERTKKLLFESTYRIGRLTDAAFSLSTSFQNLTKKKNEKKKPLSMKPMRTGGAVPMSANNDELAYILSHPDYYVDFNVPWNLSVYYNIVYTKPALTDTIIQTFTFSGDVNITEKWKIGFHSGFDFVKKDFTFTQLNIYRDLHCWEMHFDWVPFGFRKSYMLNVAVKASVLQDLKLSRKRDWYDYN